MAYGLRYQAEVFWIGPGAGPMSALTPPSLPGTGGGTGQIKQVDTSSSPIVGSVTTGLTSIGTYTGVPVTNTFTNADVTTLLQAMAVDLFSQLTSAAVQGQIQGFASGNP